MTTIDPQDLEDFLREGGSGLDEAEPRLVELLGRWEEDSRVDEETLNGIFRTFHSMKGVAGFLGLETVQRTTHKLENLLDEMRRDKLAPSQEILQILFDGCDFLRQVLAGLSKNGNDTGHEDGAQALILAIEAQISPKKDSQKALSPERGEILAFDFFRNPDFQPLFNQAAGSLVEELEAGLVELLDRPQDKTILKPAPYLLEKLEKNSRWVGRDSLGEAASIMQKSINFHLQESALPSGFNLQLFEATASLKTMLHHLDSSEIPQAVLSLSGVSQGGRPEEATLAKPQEEAPQDDRRKGDRRRAEPSSPEETTGRPKEIRVDVEKLDRLIAQIEDLGIATALISISPDDPTFNLEQFHQSSSLLKNVTMGLQQVAIAVRMVPVQSTFRKMVRLVHDVSQKTGKKVQLELGGESTEIDKNDVDLIQDPLVHLIRNSIDHGIESTEERQASGKDPSARIRLSAWHSGGEVFLRVEDDGRGIDRQKVLQKARQKGILDASSPDPTEAEICRLIFMPGFSTAEQVSDISGRGVGMDVVRRNIEELKGGIDVESEAGKGTRITIRLPVNSSLVDTMQVRVGVTRYSIRIASIHESFKPSRRDCVTTPDGREFVRLRERLHPVVRLHRLHSIAPDHESLTKGILILVEAGNQFCALFVDEILGKLQTVLKPLPGFFGSLKAVSGCSVVGTGSADVSWALDLSEVAR